MLGITLASNSFKAVRLTLNNNDTNVEMTQLMTSGSN